MAIGTPTPVVAVATTSMLSALCIISVTLRFWTRSFHRSRLGLDDWLILPALLLILCMNAGVIAGVRLKSLTYPTPVIDPNTPPSTSSYQARVAGLIEWILQLMQVPSLGCIKLSFMFFFRRIFLVSRYSKFGIVTIMMITIITMWSVAFFLGFLLMCRGNISAYWISLKLQFANCGATLKFENGFALSDCLLDIMIVFIPIPMVWRLNMTRGRKLGVTASFTVGTLAVLASMVRLAVFYQGIAVAFKPWVDNDLLITRVIFWSMVETNLALIAACLPLLHGNFGRSFYEVTIRNLRRVKPMGLSTRRSDTFIADGTRNRNDSTTSHAKMVTQGSLEPSVETYAYAVRDLSQRRRDPDIPLGEIAVNSTITQSQSIV